MGIPKSTTYLLLNELRRQRFLALITRKIFVCGPSWWSFPVCVKQDGSPGTGSTAFDATDGTTGLLCHLGIIDNGSAYYI